MISEITLVMFNAIRILEDTRRTKSRQHVWSLLIVISSDQYYLVRPLIGATFVLQLSRHEMSLPYATEVRYEAGKVAVLVGKIRDYSCLSAISDNE